MNIYFHELRSHWKGFLGWTVGMVFTVVSGMVKFQGYSTTPGQSNITEILKAFPKPLLAVFGISGIDITKLIGYVGVMYLYIVLIAALYAAPAGADIISKEERDKTSEFLYTKPASRLRIFTEKIFAAATFQSVFFAITAATTLWITDYYDKGTGLNPQVMNLMWGVLLFQIVAFAFGIFFAGILKNPKLPTPAVTTVVITSYLLSVIIDVNGKLDFLSPLTPFKYFGASKILADGHLDAFYVVLVSVLSVVLLAVGYYGYNRRDLTV